MSDTGLRGLALLDAAIAQIEAHPETWHQEWYRCESGMCVAGWVAELAGGLWADTDDDGLYPEPDDPAEDIGTIEREDDDRLLVGAFDRARRLTDISALDALRLFAASNDLDNIKVIRDQIAAGGAS